MSVRRIIGCALFLTLQSVGLRAWRWKFWETPTAEEKRTELQREQVDKPNDPYLNYNLGVADYKMGDYQQATQNFQRAQEHAKDKPDFKKRVYFNLGQSLYKLVNQQLGDGWEGRELDEQLLKDSLVKAQKSLEQFNNVLVLEQDNKAALYHKTLVEDLITRLLKKLQQQQQKKDQEDQKNKDQQNQDKQNDQGGRDQQNQSDQGRDRQQGDQDNEQGNGQGQEGDEQNQQDEQQQSGDGQGGENDEQERTGKDQSRENDKKNGKEPEQKGQGGVDGSQKKPEQERTGKGGQDQNREQQGRDERSEQGSDGSNEQKNQAGGKQQSPETSSNGNASQGQAGMQGAQNSSPAPGETFEQRSARAVLDSLEQGEANAQKQMLQRQARGGGGMMDPTQKPW